MMRAMPVNLWSLRGLQEARALDAVQECIAGKRLGAAQRLGVPAVRLRVVLAVEDELLTDTRTVEDTNR